MARFVAMFMLLASSVALAGPIEGPKEFRRDTVGVFTVKAKGVLNVPTPAGLSIVQTGDKWYVAGVPATYKIEGTDYWVDFDTKKFGFDPVAVEFSILAGDVVPPGPGPIPPGPVPPVPPLPDPSVRTNPFTDDAGRVLILWDPLGTPLTATQTSIIYGEKARAAMDAFAPNDGVRIWPKGQQSTTKVWADALARPVASYPWLLLGKGSKGYSGPLPSSTVEEFMATLAQMNATGEMKAPPVIKSEVAPANPFIFGATTTYTSPACTQVWRNGRWVTICP